MRVKRWVSYREADQKKSAPCGGLGGFFNFKKGGMRWKDYIDMWGEGAIPYVEAIRTAVLGSNLRLTGEEHQHGPNGVPLFEDGKVATFSYRGWGDLMAAIWSEEEDRDYCYMDFYM